MISEIPIETINNATIVLFYDILPIVKFINPQAIHMIYNHVNYMSRLNKIINKATDVEAFVETRHKFYYKWMYLGWNMLPPNYPLCKQWHDKNYYNVTNWVHKRLSHEDYLNLDLYTTTNMNSLITKVILERYDYDDNDNTMQWNISYGYGNGGREYYNDKNYTGNNENGREMAGGHWVYEKIGPATSAEWTPATMSMTISSTVPHMTTTTCHKLTAMTTTNTMKPWTHSWKGQWP